MSFDEWMETDNAKATYDLFVNHFAIGPNVVRAAMQESFDAGRATNHWLEQELSKVESA